MDTPITITIYGVLITLLIMAGLTVLVLLIILIIKAIKLFGKINMFVDSNSAPLTASIKNIPGITENVLEVSENMTGVSRSAGEIMDNVDGFLETSSIGEGGILGTITTVASLVRSIIQVIKKITGNDD